MHFIKDHNFNTNEEESRGLLAGCESTCMGNGHAAGSGFSTMPQISGSAAFSSNQYTHDQNWNKDNENKYGRFSSLPTPGFEQRKQPESRSSDMHIEMREMKGSVHAMINVIATNMLREQKLKAIKREWASVALVLDRMFFVIYIVAITTSLVLTFPKPPDDYSTVAM